MRKILLPFIIVLLVGCNLNMKQNKNTPKEDFTEFSKRFYTDSAFQLSRINFPLKGEYNVRVPISATNAIGDSIITEWKKENWVILKNTDLPLKDTIITIGENTYTRKIKRTANWTTISTIIESSGFSVLEKYALQDGKWYLIFYSDLCY